MLSVVYAVVMCLSVCLCVTLRYCIKTAKRKQRRTIPSGESAKNARSITLLSLRQHYLVAMATSFDKLENKLLSYGEKIAKIGPVYLEIFD